MNYISIGKISSAVGIRGEVRLYLYSRDVKHFESYTRLYFLNRDASRRFSRLSIAQKNDFQPNESELKAFNIEKFRVANGQIIAKFDEIDDRNTAEEFQFTELFIVDEDLCNT
ncbi:MAG: hypothetical protein HUJ63_01115, partial [Enterococcus sp.]|nr:hypothetical protein [Enterococcus sp.]